MADTTANTEETPPKSKAKPVIIVALLALLSAGGGFAGVTLGLIPNLLAPQDQSQDMVPDLSGLGKYSFVPIPVTTLTLTGSDEFKLLRIMAELEVHPDAASAVADLMPRILDVMNGYLRALDTSELVAPYALQDIRRQLLRRVQIVTGPNVVNDLLVTEFLLN